MFWLGGSELKFLISRGQGFIVGLLLLAESTPFLGSLSHQGPEAKYLRQKVSFLRSEDKVSSNGKAP